MAINKILLLGNPELYRVSEEIKEIELNVIKPVVTDLHDSMMNFRKKYGFGRAIAAPQIGFFKRLIYLHIDKPVVIINPVLADFSDITFEVWDDCMSFPDLLVKVRRHKSCKITFKDLEWNDQQMVISDDLSELIQHEYDHLDGILAVQRAIDKFSFALSSERVNLM